MSRGEQIVVASDQRFVVTYPDQVKVVDAWTRQLAALVKSEGKSIRTVRVWSITRTDE